MATNFIETIKENIRDDEAQTMSNKPYIDLNIDDRKILKNPSEPHKTKVSANLTTNKLMGRKQALQYLKNDRIDPYGSNKIKEEVVAFLNNGGEGIDLTFEETCMIYGIANIFTKFDYPDYVECSERELYKAMKYDKNLSGWQRQRLRKIVEDLSNKKFPIYWTEGDGWRWLTFDTLIKLAWGIESEEGRVEFIKSLPTRNNFTRYKIAFNKMLIGNMHKNYRLGEPNIGKEIKEYRKSKKGRPSKYDIRLYDLLLNENKRVIKRNYLKMAQAPMLMDHYIRERKFKLIRKKLNSIYKMYKELGYLLDYEIDIKGAKNRIDVFYLNPDKFYRLRDQN